MYRYHIEALNENSLLLRFLVAPSAIDERLNRSITALAHQAEACDWVIEQIPSYNTLYLSYHASMINFSSARQQLVDWMSAIDETTLSQAQRIIEIPFYAGLEVALDLAELADSCNITTDEWLMIFVSRVYRCYALGFAPGFGYMGFIDKRLQAPRKTEPRPFVCQGSVAIADRQTGVYPLSGPGGWQIIGRTPMPLLNYEKTPITPYRVGDQIRFVRIDKEAFCREGGVLSA